MTDYSSYIARIESTHKRIYWNMPFESTRTQVSRGTGFFIDVGALVDPIQDENGHVGRFMITCAHVVQNTDFGNLRVVLANDLDRRYQAATVLTCPDIDVAVVMVFLPPQARIKCFKMGNSDELETISNRSVTAVGFPLGGGIKVSQGVFSGIARHKGIQHTSPISPGSSGCPLLNFKNEVVGINDKGEVAATVSNIHYAVPINLAIIVVHDAVRSKKILYRIPKLGVCFHNTSKAMLEHIHKSEPMEEGVVIYRFEDEFVRHLLQLNESKKDMITQYLGDGSGNNTPKASPSFFLTNIAWEGEVEDESETYKTAVEALRQNGQQSKVDMNGLVEVAWTRQKIQLETLLKRIPSHFTITLTGRFNPVGAHTSPVALKCSKHFSNKGVLKTLHYPFFEDPIRFIEDTYFCFMGMCVVLLNMNHYMFLKDQLCVPRHSLQENRFVVVKVFDQSSLADSHILSAGDELHCLVSDDGEHPITCNNVIELKQQICDIIKKYGRIGVKNKNNRWFHMDSNAMLEQEKLFESRRIYVPDPDLIRALNQSVFRVGAQKLKASNNPTPDTTPDEATTATTTTDATPNQTAATGKPTATGKPIATNTPNPSPSEAPEPATTNPSKATTSDKEQTLSFIDIPHQVSKQKSWKMIPMSHNDAVSNDTSLTEKSI